MAGTGTTQSPSKASDAKDKARPAFGSPPAGAMKYVVITGGTISGLGNGTTISSIGAVLRSHGLRVTAISIDPYLNIDAGTMSPFEHGEVYVLEDGARYDYAHAITPEGRLIKKVRPQWLPANAPGAPYPDSLGDAYAEVPPLKPWP